MHQAVIHPLTPGNPAYALAKVGAVGGLFALRMFFVRRDRSGDRDEAVEEPATEPKPHPVSRRKARRSRKRR